MQTRRVGWWIKQTQLSSRSSVHILSATKSQQWPFLTSSTNIFKLHHKCNIVYFISPQTVILSGSNQIPKRTMSISQCLKWWRPPDFFLCSMSWTHKLRWCLKTHKKLKLMTTWKVYWRFFHDILRSNVEISVNKRISLSVKLFLWMKLMSRDFLPHSRWSLTQTSTAKWV